MYRALACSMALALAGCAAHAVRCDARLQAINAPLPRAARHLEPGAENNAPDPGPQTLRTGTAGTAQDP